MIALASVSGIEAIAAGGFTGVRIAGTVQADSFDFSAVDLTGIVAIDAGAGNDTLSGAAAADLIDGGGGADNLHGAGGTDRLFGNGGNDILQGDTGFDTLVGGAGTDTLSGGTGSDVFRFDAWIESRPGALADRILDFSAGSDRIDVSGIDSNRWVPDESITRSALSPRRAPAGRRFRQSGTGAGSSVRPCSATAARLRIRRSRAACCRGSMDGKSGTSRTRAAASSMALAAGQYSNSDAQVTAAQLNTALRAALLGSDPVPPDLDAVSIHSYRAPVNTIALGSAARQSMISSFDWGGVPLWLTGYSKDSSDGCSGTDSTCGEGAQYCLYRDFQYRNWGPDQVSMFDRAFWYALSDVMTPQRTLSLGYGALAECGVCTAPCNYAYYSKLLYGEMQRTLGRTPVTPHTPFGP